VCSHSGMSDNAHDLRKQILIVAQAGGPDDKASAWAHVHIDDPVAFASNHFHSLAVGRRGVFSWGRGTLGVLGHGGEEDEDRPRLIEKLEGRLLDSVSCGTYHSAVVTAEGKLYVWGWDALDTAEEGVIETSFATLPRPVALGVGMRVAGVSCGCFATAAWDVGGKLFTWGRGDSGQLGHGSTDSVAHPRPVEALRSTRTAQVVFGGLATESAHTGFMLVRSSSGMLFSCGSDACGGLGRPQTVLYSLPAQVEGALVAGRESAVPIMHISASDSHAAAVSNDGALYVWGQGAEAADAADGLGPLEVPNVPLLLNTACTAQNVICLSQAGEVIMLDGGRAKPPRPRGRPFPSKALAVFGGGHHVSILLSGSDAAFRQAQEQREKAADELLGGLRPELKKLLLEPVNTSSPHQLRHELRLLRDLLQAEKSKLAKLEAREPEPTADPQYARPSADTWTNASEVRRPGDGLPQPPPPGLTNRTVLRPSGAQIFSVNKEGYF